MSAVKQINNWHAKAMEHAAIAESHRLNGDFDRAKTEFLHALSLETQAALATSELRGMDIEPTRSILFRSAASLAIDCEEWEEALLLIEKGMEGNCPKILEGEFKALQLMIPRQPSEDFGPASFIPTSRDGKRLALCIGIDNAPGASSLQDCVNESNHWSEFLLSKGFAVLQLTNGAATREAIVHGIRRLFDSSKPGDVIVIQYAGHVANLKNVDSDASSGNTSGKEKALMPYDFASGNLLSDSDLAELSQTVKSGVSVTFFINGPDSEQKTRIFKSNEQMSGVRFVELSKKTRIDQIVAELLS